jgi:glutathione S-transferase
VFNRFVAPRVLGRPGDEAAAEQGMAEIAPMLDYLEGAVPAEGWLTGDTFSIGDIAVASVLRTLAYAMPSPDPDRHSATAAWFARVGEQPCWRVVAEREVAAVATLG